MNTNNHRHIVIAGGTGFIGRLLTPFLLEHNYHVTILTRRTDTPPDTDNLRYLLWQPETPEILLNSDEEPPQWARALSGSAALINLAGINLAAQRWTEAFKQQILQSRLHASRTLVATLDKITDPPPLFLQASAIGIYGNAGDESIDESASFGFTFLADVARQWETAASQLAHPDIRQSCLRFGVVLHPAGGLLQNIMPMFRKGIGGPWGSGRQYLSWIHARDLCRALLHLIDHPSPTGPVNVTAPNPVTVTDFSRTLARLIHRPAFCRAPAFALKLILGDMADEMLLHSQRALPQNLLEHDFSFDFPNLQPALENLLRNHDQSSPPTPIGAAHESQ